MTAAGTTRMLHLVARIGGEWFAFAVHEVDEAIDAPAVEPVPGARPGLAGQLCVRGRTLSAWDAAWALGVPRPSSAGAALIIGHGAARTALLVDDVGDVVPLDAAAARPVPRAVDGEGVLGGVCIDASPLGRLVNLVRVDALLTRLAGLQASTGGSER